MVKLLHIFGRYGRFLEEKYSSLLNIRSVGGACLKKYAVQVITYLEYYGSHRSISVSCIHLGQKVPTVCPRFIQQQRSLYTKVKAVRS